MMRLIYLAIVVWFAIAAQSRAQSPSQDHVALQLRVARAELSRAGGVAELIELATRGDTPTRVLALRGLGRIGGSVDATNGRSPGLQVLVDALADPTPAIIAAGAAALTVTASLDGVELGIDDALFSALAASAASAPSVLEAIGCAGSIAAQPALVSALSDPRLAEPAALALGQHGRRALPYDDAARAALVHASASADAAVRYAAVYALAREATPAESPAIIAALSERLHDRAPEVRAQAISALGKRDALPAARAARARPESLLYDRDFRVATQAVRAFGSSDAGLDAIAVAIALRFGELALVGDPSVAQVVLEGITALSGAPSRPIGARVLRALAHRAQRATAVPALTRGLIECNARAAWLRTQTNPDYALLRTCASDALPDELRLPLVAQLIAADIGSLDARRSALAGLLGHPDARVRAAGIGALPALFDELDAPAQHDALVEVVDALASADAVIVGTALEFMPELYEGASVEDRAAIESALLERADSEADPEIGAMLLGLIGQLELAAGAPACRAALEGPAVLADAGAACLDALGESVPPRTPSGALPSPPVDLTSVVGETLRWRLTTTRGEIVVSLRPDIAPWTVAAIVALTRDGFYDGLAFHRVVSDFVVQGGDPTETGWGGPGFALPAEPATRADAHGFRRGGVGVADAGKDSGGSQFFIMHSRAAYLDARYSYFGSVESGQDTAEALLVGDRILHATIE